MKADYNLTLRFMADYPEDAARVLEVMDTKEARALVEDTPLTSTASVLERVNSTTLAGLLQHLSDSRLASLLEIMHQEKSIAALRNMETPARESILSRCKPEHSALLRRLLRFPEGVAGAIMNPRFLALPLDLSIRDALKRIRRSGTNMSNRIYVTGHGGKLQGYLNPLELYTSKITLDLTTVVRGDMGSLKANQSLAEIESHPDWARFSELPVTDDKGILIGILDYAAYRALESGAELPRSNSTDNAAGALGELYTIGFAAVLKGAAAGIGTKETRHYGN